MGQCFQKQPKSHRSKDKSSSSRGKPIDSDRASSSSSSSTKHTPHQPGDVQKPLPGASPQQQQPSNQRLSQDANAANRKNESKKKNKKDVKPSNAQANNNSANSDEDSHSDGKFSKKQLIAFFNTYKDKDEEGAGDDEVIGPEGVEKLCGDLDVSTEDVVTLLLAWKLNAQEMGYFTKQEWTEGLEKLGIDTAEKLKAYLPILRRELEDNETFKVIYRFAFNYVKTDKDQKVIDVGLAGAMLSLLLVPRYPLAASFVNFLQEQDSYKAINVDQWVNLLEFCKVAGPDFAGYDENGAWPCIIDEWVEFSRKDNPQEQY